MNFKEKIANYCLGNFQLNHFPSIALTALEEGIESESMLILAGMCDRDNTFEIQQYIDSSINELKIVFPDKYTSAQILLSYYFNKMINYPELAYEIMIVIDNDIMKKVDWENELQLPKIKYVGEELGLEKVYTWYRELQDFEDDSMLLYYNELPRNKQKEKFISNLIVEAKKLKDRIDQDLNKQKRQKNYI
jgi:hypothetical protein